MTKVSVTGAKGRMGRKVVDLICREKDLSITAQIDAGDSLANAARDCDVIIDFTTPSASAENVLIAASMGKPIVIGTTGLDGTAEEAVRKASESVAIVYAPNMSIGVNVMFKLVQTAARALGPGYSVLIEETHHVHKKDAPSGTAKKIADIAKRERNDEGVEVQSIRRGEVVGDHEIRFSSQDETLIVRHSAADRGIFAHGAIAAARWVVGKPAGLYDMADVLGLKQ